MKVNVSEGVHTVPGSFAAHVADVAARWNVPKTALLAEIGVTLETLDDPASRRTATSASRP
jgi:hypothetical protein